MFYSVLALYKNIEEKQKQKTANLEQKPNERSLLDEVRDTMRRIFAKKQQKIK